MYYNANKIYDIIIWEYIIKKMYILLYLRRQQNIVVVRYDEYLRLIPIILYIHQNILLTKEQ